MPPSSNASARLEFRPLADRKARLSLVSLSLVPAMAVAGLESLAWWQRGLLALALSLIAANGARRLLPGAHAAAVTSVVFDEPAAAAAMVVRLALRDGVERRAVLCPSSLVLPRIALLVFRFDRGGAALGPGQRLPLRVCAVLRAANHPPGHWRQLQWRLRWPAHALRQQPQRRERPPSATPLG